MQQQMPMDLEGMLRMLAGMPREERQFRQTEMLDMFFSMPGERAAMMMRSVIEAKLKLSEAQQLALGETQTAVVADYPAQKRAFLLRAHKRAIEGLPEAERMRDMQLTQAAARRLDPQRQQRIAEAMQDVMGSRAWGAITHRAMWTSNFHGEYGRASLATVMPRYIGVTSRGSWKPWWTPDVAQGRSRRVRAGSISHVETTSSPEAWLTVVLGNRIRVLHTFTPAESVPAAPSMPYMDLVDVGERASPLFLPELNRAIPFGKTIVPMEKE